ncbi:MULTISPECIES: HRDC domain-containing protein [Paenibacillus]|uniref:HRDC domain-containing protein n=1 Tax=Paenibacillus TaxID=44249 RepID=UPI0022B907E0|nr:HRDC domain-containing protein [Paenibacillus caseinilyticus]MCZ8519361.1 HRDC domain-containing protein [Paenibacillus caseinilyticus]
MNLMFLNSMERTTAEGEVHTAQVTIGESEGTWIVMWNESPDEGLGAAETWYEGSEWNGMMQTFRERVFAKQCEGYAPMLEIQVSELSALDGRLAYMQPLHFYSDRHSQDDLYEALRQWRFKQATQEGKAPFIVATNRLLKMISAFVPQTEEELLQLPGFGKTKAASYGAAILGITGGRDRAGSFPLTWVESAVDPAELNTWLLQEKERKRKAEADKQEVKLRILEAVQRGEKLDAVQEQTKIQRRNLLLWLEELDRDGYDLEAYIKAMLEEVEESRIAAAWQAFQLQGDRYLKPVLQAVYKGEELSAKDNERAYEWLRLLRMKYRRANAEQHAAS